MVGWDYTFFQNMVGKWVELPPTDHALLKPLVPLMENGSAQ